MNLILKSLVLVAAVAVLLFAARWCAPARLPATQSPAMIDVALEGKRLRYLIGNDDPGAGAADAFTVVSYATTKPLPAGLSGAYVNLLSEEGSPERYGPYLRPTDTARKYREGVPDPAGPGFERNLRDQLERRRQQGFTIVGDLDNPDAFTCQTIMRAYDVVKEYGMAVVAKNPGLGCALRDGSEARSREEALGLLRRASAIISERGVSSPTDVDELRASAGRPDMQAWFVFFGTGRGAAGAAAREIAARGLRNMGVTYSAGGEYTDAQDVR